MIKLKTILQEKKDLDNKHIDQLEKLTDRNEHTAARRYLADLIGHKKSNIGRTEAGKTYFSRQPMPKLIQMIESIPKLEL